MRALRYYLQRTSSLRKDKELLFISYRNNFPKDICKTTVSSWLIQTIKYCLQNCSEETARIANVRAHDIRALAASWSFKHAVPLQDIMTACSWKAHDTFISFYLKDVSLTDTSGSHSIGPFVAAQNTLF